MQMRITPVFSTPVPRLSLGHLSGSNERKHLEAAGKSGSKNRNERDRAIGFIPELASLEASGYIPPSSSAAKGGRTTPFKQQKTTTTPTPPIRSSLLNDIRFQLNTQLAVGCFWKKPPERSQPSTPERQKELLAESNNDDQSTTVNTEASTSLSASLSALVEQIKALQIKRDRLLKEQAAEAARKAQEAEKVAERQRVEAQSIHEQRVKAKEKLKRDAEAVSADIRTSLIICRAIERLENSEGYQSFLKAQSDDIRQLRVQILKLTSSVPNQLAATCSRLLDTYSAISEVRRSLLQSQAASICTSVLGPSFGETLEATAKVESTILAPLMTLSLPMFHLYLKLSQIILDSCQQQVSIQPTTVWMYAHFLGMLFNGWSSDFQLVFYGCLYRQSLWLIPLPVSDTQKRKEASSEEMAAWCKRISSFFRLRLAICQSQKAGGECWKLVARLLNRIVTRLTHPLSVFLLEAVFDIAYCQLSELNATQFLKMVILCQQEHLAVLKKLCVENDVWAEWKVPIIKLDERLKWIISMRGIVKEKPAGYQMMQQASEIDADI